ncbi:protein MEI2-like 7 [Triticum aestivum]|uniref:protein MEI2-like 7 n=1 Tax=Triticum aestivum TaxID=4565 RepID=UPI001D012945|nr:protein MEI2-like 7 [Triticum aestivum]
MAATGLNAYARPYSRRSARAHHAPPKPHPFMTPEHHGAAGYRPPCPLAANHSRAAFPERHYPGPLPPRPFFREHVAGPRPHHGRPRGPMLDPEKLYARAVHSFNHKHKARAAAAGKGKGGGPATRALLPAAPPCGPRGQRGRGRSEVYVPAARGGGRERSPSPALTRRRAWPVPPPAWAWHGRSRTTVMIRNIPNKLTRPSMMKLLDDHCARVNRRRGPAAYDFLYLPMDFRQRCSNKGYAFVNFTTAEAARGLHYALHGRGWHRSLGSAKIINIAAAYMQGRHRLVRHFSRSTFACHTDEYLPAVFSPPRDGTADPPPAEPRHLGRRVPPRVPAVQPAQQLVWVRRGEAIASQLATPSMVT